MLPMMPLSLSSFVPNKTLIPAGNSPCTKLLRCPPPSNPALHNCEASAAQSGGPSLLHRLRRPPPLPKQSRRRNPPLEPTPIGESLQVGYQESGMDTAQNSLVRESPLNFLRMLSLKLSENGGFKCLIGKPNAQPVLTYKLIKLLPTVGCEADAATRYNTKERTIGGIDNKVSAFAYDRSGSYVAVWALENHGESRLLELEHCLVDPRNQEVRVRIIQNIWVEKRKLELRMIKIFSEQWYGPFRNGEQLGGCAIRESGFASTGAMKESEILGMWQRTSVAASFQSVQTDVVREFVDDRPQKLIRDPKGLVTLPKQLWCSLKEREDGETWGEVGCLLDHGCAMTSRSIFADDGSLKAIEIGRETAVLSA